MPRSEKELKRDAARARQKIERKGALIRLAKRRIAKWSRKLRAAKKGTPRHARAARKLVLWRRRLHDAIYLRHNWQQILTDALTALAKRTPPGRKLLHIAESYIGEQEGGAFHRKAVAFVGGEIGWPWCSISIAEWLHEAFGYTRSELPASAPYSGCWAAWSGGKRVAIANRQPGDIEVYDWGDGGLTDHVAVNRDNATHVGGNQAPGAGQVNVRDTYPGTIVFVIRPRKRKA